MQEVKKQCVGIDISKSDFTVAICNLMDDQSVSFSEVQSFSNNKTGFNQLNKWVKKLLLKGVKVVYLMEATGVYYEPLAYHLHKIKKTVHVVLPNKAKYYIASLNLKTKTDHTDALALAQFGVERKFDPWQPPAPIYKKLKELSRYRTSLIEDRVVFLNRISSNEAAEQGNTFVKKSMTDIIKKIDKQIEKAEKEMLLVIDQDQKLKQRLENICTTKGIRIFSVITVIAETAGFELVSNAKQLTSFAGFDVVQRQSGSSVNGKSRISKKGNAHIRRALYFPAISAVRWNPKFKAQYKRLLEKGKPKMVATTAVARKLLTLIYALWKNNQPFIENYEQLKTNKKIAPELAEATQDSHNDFLIS